MVAVAEKQVFQSLSEKVGRFDLKDKTFAIPEMNPIGPRLIAASFRSFGIRALVMETYKGLDLGIEYSSGKECYPCQVTMGDILHFLKTEQIRLGKAFQADDYIYFMPESSGPCRFGMYNKYQRMVLDSFPDLKEVRIGSLTTKDGYALDGLIARDKVRDLKKAAYFGLVVGDVLERLVWRVRPYEKEAGATDAYMEQAVPVMIKTFEVYGKQKNFKAILNQLEETVQGAVPLIDPRIPPKPLIGMVGEIYLRSHVLSNQQIVKVLEKYGAEVVNASIGEWMNYITYEGLRKVREEWRLSLKQLQLSSFFRHLRAWLRFRGELFYQEYRQNQAFQRARRHLDLAADHQVMHLEQMLREQDLFSFDVGTEACLSISGIMEYIRHGFNGVINVYPFTCMPSTVTAAVVKPLMSRHRIPYLDTAYDAGYQPGRDAAVRTFMYQAQQHMRKNGRKKH
ncbi:MAG: CoA activase [Desulfobacteraceae bacterium]|nr:MAG: CoA activase [Desulfobacteraceae bacterium]